MKKIIIATIIICIFSTSISMASTEEELIDSQMDSFNISNFIAEANKYSNEVLKDMDIKDLLDDAIKGKLDTNELIKNCVPLLGTEIKDALKVMKVISSVEGTSALYEEATLKANLLPFKDWNADNTYYGDIADEINAGNTAPLIYVGWENTLVNTGYRMLEYIQDKATIKDVVDQLDKDQDRVVNNKPEVITTTTEVISQKSCAKLIGRCFMEATKSDAALISLGKWIKGNGKEQNMAGVNGKLYAQDITESDICSILPTGWYDTIQTVQLSGREIKQLCKDGYDAAGTGNTYPYVLVKDKKLEADQTYKVVICGAGKELTLNDSGIVGMNAAKDFFSKFKTLSEADVK